MRGRFLFLVMILAALWSCEDPTTIPVSKGFNGNKLQVAYADTFSVITSTVQLDSVLTNGTGTILLGKYIDDKLGAISSSSYFQMGFNGVFTPDLTFIFDSVSLIFHYNHSFSGDTTKPVTVNLYQISEQMYYRVLPDPYLQDIKLSSFDNVSGGFYNTTQFKYNPTPITSKTFYFRPHKDSLVLPLPPSFGLKWLTLAQSDSAQQAGLFQNVGTFISYFFQGFYMDVDQGTDACIVGFNSNTVKLRLYYRRYYGDILKESHYDFIVYPQSGTSSAYQFNHIEYDRTGTDLANQPILTPVSTNVTEHINFVQSGSALVTRLDFPSVKSFFQLNNGVILNAAYLDIQPLRGSYPRNFLPPSSLSLYLTDDSNMPLGGPVTGGTASIIYDYELGLNTVYRYQLFPYIFSQLKGSAFNYVQPLILAPSASQGSSIQRVYLGDRFYPDTKITLKIYYTYAIN